MAMAKHVLEMLDQAIAALTVDEIEVHTRDTGAAGGVLAGAQVPLLQRSIGLDLVRIESAMSARGQTLLSATAACIDQALVALAEARDELRREDAPKVSARPKTHIRFKVETTPGIDPDKSMPPRKRCRGKLKPAPIFLPPSTIGKIIDLSQQPRPQVTHVPVKPVKLVDRPRRSEYPRLAKANDDTHGTHAPVEVRDGHGDQHEECREGSENGRAGYSRTNQSGCEGSEDRPGLQAGRVHGSNGPSGLDQHHGPAAAEEVRPENLDRQAAADHLDWPDAPLPEAPEAFVAPDNARGQVLPTDRQVMFPIPSKPLRPAREERLARQRREHDARALEAPVDVALHRGERPRIEIIRAAAEALRRKTAAAHPPVPSLGQPVAAQPVRLPPLPTQTRRERLDAATAFLKRQAILVSVVDRSALVRRYRISGKRESVFAEDVIAIAIERGMDTEGNRA